MSAPEIRAAEGGATLRVRVSPGASRERIAGVHGAALKVSVRAAPERGKANRAVERLLAGALGARPADVAVVQGETGRDKRVRFRGWEASALREAVAAVLVTLDPP